MQLTNVFRKSKLFHLFQKKTTTLNYTERQTKALINPFRNGSILSSSNQHLNLKSSLSLLNTNNNAAAVLIQKRNLSQEAKVAIACGSALLVYAIGPLQLFSSFVTVSAYLSLGIVLTSGALLFMIRSANMTARNRPSHMRWVLLGGAIVTLIFFNPATIAKAGAYISLFCLLASATVLGVIVHRNRLLIEGIMKGMSMGHMRSLEFVLDPAQNFIQSNRILTKNMKGNCHIVKVERFNQNEKSRSAPLELILAIKSDSTTGTIRFKGIVDANEKVEFTKAILIVDPTQRQIDLLKDEEDDEDVIEAEYVDVK